METLSDFSPKQISIPLKSLDELIVIQSKKMVGKTLKRLEISDDKEIQKAQIKEVIYESMRDLLDYIIAINYGLNVYNIEAKINKETK